MYLSICVYLLFILSFLFFFFNDTATTEIYTLSLHDALPISIELEIPARPEFVALARLVVSSLASTRRDLADERIDDLKVADRKSTRLNSSHVEISYAVFCMKKKKKSKIETYVQHSSL